MKYVVEMGSRAITYIPNFIKTGSDTRKLIEGIHRHTDNRLEDLIEISF
jgi:hypothetical protein